MDDHGLRACGNLGRVVPLGDAHGVTRRMDAARRRKSNQASRALGVVRNRGDDHRTFESGDEILEDPGVVIRCINATTAGRHPDTVPATVRTHTPSACSATLCPALVTYFKAAKIDPWLTGSSTGV